MDNNLFFLIPGVNGLGNNQLIKIFTFINLLLFICFRQELSKNKIMLYHFFVCLFFTARFQPFY